MEWNENQKRAIYVSNRNVLVSAGAGSGKTAVLSERVLKLLEKGIDLDNLLVLTFTNDAASEMRERIREKILKSNNKFVKRAVEKIDTANITTFDAYSLSLVKKYHYLLGIDKSVKVCANQYVINSIASKYLDDILARHYQQKTSGIYKYFYTCPSKDDEDLRKYILKIINQLDLKSDVNSYLDTYILNHYNLEEKNNIIKQYEKAFVNSVVDEYNKEIVLNINQLRDLMDSLTCKLGTETTNKVDNIIKLLDDFECPSPLLSVRELSKFIFTHLKFNAFTDKEIEKMVSICGASVIDIIEAINTNIKVYTAFKKNKFDSASKYNSAFDDEEMLNESFDFDKECSEFFIEIIKELNDLLTQYKKEHNYFQFVDIAKMAIKLVKDETLSIGKELKESLKEILIDEFQDTSDLQDEFISYISNNNVYVVGDIKQSIYRFRNANPSIFKSKYDSYRKYTKEDAKADDIEYQTIKCKAEEVGIDEDDFNYDSIIKDLSITKKDAIKIDLLENYRSRSEVLNAIDDIFCPLMTNKYGDANYHESHKTHFGFKDYNNPENQTKSKGLRIVEYETIEELKEKTIDKMYELDALTEMSENDDENADLFENFVNNEIECFFIASDINKKIKEKFQVYDKKQGKMRNAEYKDFCILIDRATNFEKYKKILESKQIPCAINAKINIKDSSLSYTILSLFKLLTLEKNQNYNEDYYHAFMSVGRSFICMMDDNYLFEFVKENKSKIPQSNIITDTIKEIVELIDECSNKEVYYELIKKFNIIQKLKLIGDIEGNLIVIEYFSNMIKEFSQLEYNFYEIVDFINEAFKIDAKLEYEVDLQGKNAVKIMTIHKSKGLEFPICYFPILNKKINEQSYNERVGFNQDLGFYFSNTYQQSVIRELNKKEGISKDISEKIRLFYVGLTRAREEMIVILPKPKEEKKFKGCLAKARSFSDFMQYIYSSKLDKYKETLDVSSLDYEKNYQDINKKLKLEYNNKPSYDDKSYLGEIVTKERISKTIHTILTDKERSSIEFGKKLHSIMENLDLKLPNLANLDNFEKSKINAILNNQLFINIKNSEYYPEYEFIKVIDGKEYHGIIDLLVVYNDHIDIIDYKLSNIDDVAYDEQLKIYKKYVSTISELPINCYLLSLIKNEFRKVE